MCTLPWNEHAGKSMLLFFMITQVDTKSSQCLYKEIVP